MFACSQPSCIALTYLDRLALPNLEACTHTNYPIRMEKRIFSYHSLKKSKGPSRVEYTPQVSGQEICCKSLKLSIAMLFDTFVALIFN